MIIGFDAKRLFNNFTGLGNYSRTLLHNLLLYSPENEYYLYSPSIKSNPQTYEFINNPGFTSFEPNTAFPSFWRTVSILKQLQKDNLSIYHGLSHELPLGISKSGIRSVVTMHDLIFKIYPETYKIIDRTIYDKKFRYSCQAADRIIAISESTKNDIVRLYNIDSENIDVIYQSASPLFYSQNLQVDYNETLRKYKIPENYLLYVGSITERKNIATIINAYGHLPDDLKIPLVIVGSGGKYRNFIEELIVKKNLGKLVIWINNLTDNEELKVLYNKASMFIYPSVYEGFGIPVIEAMLSRTPVITSNISSLPEAGGPDSYYIQPTDAGQMAEGIKKILSDTKYRENMIESGYSYAKEKFDAEKNTRKLIDLYNRLI